MVQLDDKRYLVCIFACHGAQHTECGCHGITPSFNGQLYDVFGIEIKRIGGERRSCRMFYPLIHRQDGDIPGIGQTPVPVQGLQALQGAYIPVGIHPYLIYHIRSRNMDKLFVYRLTCMVQVVLSLSSQ